MPNDRSGISDEVSVEVNGQPLADDTKGPDPDRLADHAAETKAYNSRLRKEAKQAQ